MESMVVRDEGMIQQTYGNRATFHVVVSPRRTHPFDIDVSQMQYSREYLEHVALLLRIEAKGGQSCDGFVEKYGIVDSRDRWVATLIQIIKCVLMAEM